MTLPAPQLSSPWRRTCARCGEPRDPTGSRVIRGRYCCAACLKPAEVRVMRPRRLYKWERAELYAERAGSVPVTREALLDALAQAWLTGYEAGMEWRRAGREESPQRSSP